MAPKFIPSLLFVLHTSHVNQMCLLVSSCFSTDQIKAASLHQSALVDEGALFDCHSCAHVVLLHQRICVHFSATLHSLDASSGRTDVDV